MANTIEWDEALPANTDDASEGALRIREGKKSTREPVNRDHVFGKAADPPADSGYYNNDHSGFHRRITFKNQSDDYNVGARTSTINTGASNNNDKVTELFCSPLGSRHTDGSGTDNVLRFEGGAQTSIKEIITDVQTQTLSNKTLASPTFSGSTSGTIKGSDIGEAGTRMASFFTTINASGAVTFTDTLAVTNAITATGGVVGALTGTASLATEFTVTANNSANETVYPLFVDGVSGAQGAETDSGFTYNPSTGVLTSTKFAGIHEGNVTGDITSSGTSTFNNLTATGTLTTDDVTGTADVDLTLTKGSTAKIVLKNAGGVDISGNIVMQSSASITCGPLSATTVTATGAATLTSISAKGAFSIKDSSDVEKFAIVQASGNTTIAGTLGVTGDFAVNTNKFTVAASTGNTVVAGTLNVTGAITGDVTGNLTGTVTTPTQNSITTMTGLATVGTISAGSWEGSVIGIDKGGTGATSLAGANIVATSAGSASFSTSSGDYRSHGINTAYIESHNSSIYMNYTVKNGENVTQRGTSSYNNLAIISDRQWKENIQPTKVHSLSIIDKMSFKSFDWKEDSPEKGHVNVGLIAQELAEIYPEGVGNDIIARGGLVPCDKKGNIMQEKEMGLKPVALQMLMLKAIQELSAEVKALKA